jgi:HD-like signal output (HDOD) protein
MHDIGRIALAASMPKAYGRVLERAADRPQDLLPAERELCGINHCDAGRTLVVTWGLPEVFLEVTAKHHDAACLGRGTASILPPCCMLADSLGFGVVRFRAPRAYTDILAGLPEAARNGLPVDGSELASDIQEAIKLLETT